MSEVPLHGSGLGGRAKVEACTKVCKDVHGLSCREKGFGFRVRIHG